MPHYEVSLQSIRVGEADFIIRSLKDRQQFYDPDGSHERAGVSPASWPLFGVMWPSSIVLANLISRYPLDGLRILEIGCGLGLASLVAHSRGADIVASDYHPLAEAFLIENVALNNFPPLRFEHTDWAKLYANLGQFDLIIGSDILYEPDHPKLISAFIDRHASDDTRVIIVDPGRKQVAKFTKLMSQQDWLVRAERAEPEIAAATGFRGKILTGEKQATSC